MVLPHLTSGSISPQHAFMPLQPFIASSLCCLASCLPQQGTTMGWYCRADLQQPPASAHWTGPALLLQRGSPSRWLINTCRAHLWQPVRKHLSACLSRPGPVLPSSTPIMPHKSISSMQSTKR